MHNCGEPAGDTTALLGIAVCFYEAVVSASCAARGTTIVALLFRGKTTAAVPDG